MMDKLTFASIKCGDVLPEVEQHITQEVIWHFAVTSLDMNPVHCSPEWCKTAQVFGTPKTVQHGQQTLSLLSKVITNWAYPSGGRMKRFEVKLVKPVPVDSVCRYGGAVTELHPVGKGKDFVTVELWGKDQDGDKVAVGEAQVIIPQ
jgi:3-hydroxybutyryl-CoA dehydratase